MKLLKKLNLLPNRQEIVEALDALETELCALQDVVDILQHMPPENPMPYYLCQRIEIHTAELRCLYNHAWKIGLKGMG